MYLGELDILNEVTSSHINLRQRSSLAINANLDKELIEAAH